MATLQLVTDSKRCSSCGEEKSVTEFYFRKDRNAHNSWCKSCHTESIQKWQKRNPLKRLVHNARCRAKRIGVPFTITENDVNIPKICPVLGIKLSKAKGKPGANSPSIDRVIPAKGYVPDNIRVISHRANTIKTNATVDEILAVAEYMKREVR